MGKRDKIESIPAIGDLSAHWYSMPKSNDSKVWFKTWNETHVVCVPTLTIYVTTHMIENTYGSFVIANTP